MLEHASYVLTHMRLSGEWERSELDIRLQSGSTLGVMSVRIKCEGCGLQKHNFFFSLHEELFACKMRSTKKDEIELAMANGEDGCFVLDAVSPDRFHDRCILKAIAAANWQTPNEVTLEAFFERTQARIRMRTMFKHLYFRSFRAAFAPDKSCGLRVVEEWAKLMR